ncbi:MAG TPA: SAM-dependent methyltransferase [Ignavibacteriales bacterium]|nr:SAM-dependent methyltransferase [Ignavibacteriales bacterium]
MSTTLFEENILKLNFSFLIEKGESGILLTEAYESLDSQLASPDILFALETAKTKFNVDAVYFRHFKDGRGTIPQIYIFDNTNALLTKKEKKEIHINVWSGSQVAVYIIIEKSDVKVFDAREKPKDDDENYAKEIIKLTAETIKQFQANDFNDGLFWEEKENEKRFKFEKSATRDLIVGLKKVYNSFQTESGLNSHVALKLLVQCLLIKYLEERDEESESGYFARTYFKTYYDCNNFLEIIRSGQLLDLLDRLAEDFNGKIFEWNVKNEIEERKAIRKSKVQKLADYLDAKSEGNQFVIWRLYSFSHLPVELISSVYEELLTNSKDIVYTPEMIVSTLVDECMPLSAPNLDIKLIDVSCGSGIFLVKAYKRIIQWWRYEQWKKTGELIKPSLKTLKELLLTAIHGIDIQEDAIRLSVFSLSLAMLDEVDLNPPTWQKLRFPDLYENIITKDFFEFVTINSNTKFDLVIGNPPFNLHSGNGKEERKKYFKKLKGDIGYKNDIQIPDENPALHFLTQGMKLLKPEGLLCLIQPSGPLLYQRDLDFKRVLFSKYNLLQIIDFTKLSDVIWGKKDFSTAAVFMRNSKPDDQHVIYIAVSRTFSNVNRLFLEFDYYDFHIVPKEEILSKPFVWKANLLGGGRIRTLLDRLIQLKTLGSYLNQKEENNSWEIAEGFIEKGNKAVPCDYLTGAQYLPSKAFSENKIDWSQVEKCKIKYFHRPKSKKIYTPPHLLIKENIGRKNLSVYLSNKYLVFRANIIGIHSPQNGINELKYLEEYFRINNRLLRFYIYTTSSQLSISKATVPLKEDFMNLPFSENISDLRISESDNLVINDILAYQINNDQKSLSKNSNDEQLNKYVENYCKTLNSIYQTDTKKFQLFKILDTAKYYALHFKYSKTIIEPDKELDTDLQKYLGEIMPTDKGKEKIIHIQRIFKAYGKDQIILAKPKQLRYWLPSIALRDADETFAEYLKARYQNVKR